MVFKQMVEVVMKDSNLKKDTMYINKRDKTLIVGKLMKLNNVLMNWDI